MTEPTFDLGSLLGAASEMQATLSAAQDAVAEQRFVGSAGGGAVTVTLTGAYTAVDAHIDPAALDEGADLLGDLVLAALRDARRQVGAAQEQLTASFDPSALLGAFGGDLLGGQQAPPAAGEIEP